MSWNVKNKTDLAALRVRTTQHMTAITGDKSEGKNVLATLSAERIENVAGIVQIKDKKESGEGKKARQNLQTTL